MPTAISTGGDIGLSNLSLKTITLSLYSMSKLYECVADQ
jgi:solute carrier family 35 protein C2